MVTGEVKYWPLNPDGTVRVRKLSSKAREPFKKPSGIPLGSGLAGKAASATKKRRKMLEDM